MTPRDTNHRFLQIIRHHVLVGAFLSALLAAAFTTHLAPLEDLTGDARDDGLGLSMVDIVRTITDLPARLESDFNRHFSGREALVKAVYSFRLNALGEVDFRDVVVGKDGWLYYSGEKNLDYYQRAEMMTPIQIAALLRQLTLYRETLSEQGIGFYVVVAPNKETIYPQYLPDAIRQGDGPTLFDRILAANKDPLLTIIDLRPALLAAGEEGQVYYRTDTHWNPDGAFAAYRVIAATIGEDFPAVRPHGEKDFTRAPETISGDLSAMLAMKDVLTEESFGLKPLFPRASRMENTENNAVLKSLSSQTDLPRAMIFRDSFFNGLMPFMMEHFREAVVVRAFEPDMNWIVAEKPDLVIIEVAERYLPELLLGTK